MSETTQILLERFKARKTEKDSTSLQEARRLVNVYRSLSCFGSDFIDKYNQMLMDVKPNVRRLFSTFMGGKEVEDYLEFLEENAHLSVSANGEKEGLTVVPQNKGYLPDPDSDVDVSKKTETFSVSEAEWREMKAQNEALAKQTKDLLNIVKELGKNEKRSRGTEGYSAAPRSSSFENYSEIIEDTTGGKVDE